MMATDNELFESLWLRAEQERQNGNASEARNLYRLAFAALGLDIDEVKKALDDDLNQERLARESDT